ncbi:MAG: hypothetical protein HOV79_09150 [Hamadaea sp.]|nr:hypothetical protein [Hamadaea sp.]
MADFDADLVTLSVPKAVEATYVVTTSSPPDDIDAAALRAAERLPEPIRTAVVQMLDTPLLSLQLMPADEAPPLPTHLLRVFGASPVQLGAAASASHVVVCQAVYRVAWPPVHEWHARGLAAALAQELNGTLVDAATPRLLESRAALASLPGEDFRIALTRWILIPQSPDEGGVWLTTNGLDRYGLPELQVLDVPPELAAPWTAVLNGVATALLDTWYEALEGQEEPPFVNLPAELIISSSDVAEAYGEPEPDPERNAGVRLRLDPPDDFDEQTFLTVEPTGDFDGSREDYLAQVCDDLFGDEPDDDF